MSMPATKKSIYLKKYSILIIDDNPNNLKLLVEYLEGYDFEIMVARNGKLGLERAKMALPALILLDVLMPEMDGFETCRQLKAHPQTANIPVIFMTALESIEDKVKGFEAGGVDYITKPIDYDEVLARISTHLRIRDLTVRLNDKVDELTQTRHELIQSEKMAALGKLIAGIAHEINTPLGAIHSSVGNIADFLNKTLLQLPAFVQQLSTERQHDFFALIQKSSTIDLSLSIKEKRILKKSLMKKLESHSIPQSDTIAISLIGIGVYEDINPFLSLLQDTQCQTILEQAYQLSSLHRSVETITIASNRATKVVFALKSFARFDSLDKKVEANIAEGIDTVLTLYQNQLKPSIHVKKDIATLPLISCYPDDLNQVWINLIHNALQAMDYKGVLSIKGVLQEKYISISVTDTGKGIPSEIKSKIFEPFFTTKAVGEGSGLGLDIVKRIIEKHKGNIEVTSVVGHTTFTVLLPLNS